METAKTKNLYESRFVKAMLLLHKIGNKYLKTGAILNVQWSKQRHIIRQVQLSLKLIMSSWICLFMEMRKMLQSHLMKTDI